MEADWEIEVGGDAPIIEALWPGFVDLRRTPDRADTLPENLQLPGLAEALGRLNTTVSPVWTSKCDVWPNIEAEAFDPDELDAPSGSAKHAIACYIDLLPQSGQQWIDPAQAGDWCKRICIRVRKISLRSSRVDLVIRRAFIAPDGEDLGITAYLTACGSSQESATDQLQAALVVFADAVSAAESPAAGDSKLQ